MRIINVKKLLPVPVGGRGFSGLVRPAPAKSKSGLRRLSAQGQSLVEMAIITPLLIFFLIGIFEVGWALRNYLVLVNVNREITRFSIRPGYLNFSTQANIDASFQRVKDWTLTSVSGQLNIEFDSPDSPTTLIISHAVIDTGRPCPDDSSATCECNKFDPDDPAYDATYNPFPYDDLIIHPDLPGYGYQQETFGPETTVTGPRNSRIDFNTLATTLAGKNNKFNCEIIKKGGVPSANNVIVTELFHDQPQLFGFPLISNPYTDPVPLYTHTTMRLIGAARSTGGVEGNITAGIDTIGPICLVYPFLVKDTDIGPTQKNIIEYGWLKWDPADPEDPIIYLQRALLYPQMSLNDYPQPGGIQDGSPVTRVSLSNPAFGAELDALQGRPIIIPYTSNPAPNTVTVDGFVWVSIVSHNTSGSPNSVMASFDTTTPLPAACVTSP